MHTDIIRCRGTTIKNEGLDDYLADRVNEWHYDKRGIADTHARISATTGFSIDEIEKKLSPSNIQSTHWSVGESFAQCFLEDVWFARFPYPNSRGTKNPNASLAGADLVGFHHKDGKTVFLFGEVKTSGEDRRPPQVVTKAEGLLMQMKNLKHRNVQSSIIYWLIHHIGGKGDIHEKYLQEAIASYICQNAIRLIGILIRDTSPDKADLQYAFKRLQTNSGPIIDIWALYIPIPISSLPEKVGDK